MPDILLIQPPIEDFYLTAKRTMPYGLACVAAVLRDQGFSVGLMDALATRKTRDRPWPEEMAFLQPFYGRPDRSPLALFHRYRHFGYSLAHIAGQARASGAFLIGISSLFSAYGDLALQTAAAVKQACPQAVVVLGGHHPTALPESVLSHPAVDYAVRGDGEAVLPLLAKALRCGGPMAQIAGLAGRHSDGRLFVNPPLASAGLDQWPLPAFDLIDWRHYQRKGRSAPALSAGRGCPMRCTYCAVNAATFHGFRCRTVASVMAELEAVDALCPLGFIDFEDEHLSADRSWFLQLLEAIAARFGHRNLELRAMNGLFAPSLDDTMLAAMQRAGFKALNLALITTQPAQLKRFNRPDITAEVDRVVRSARRQGLDSVVYLIVAGPGQEPVQSINDLLFLAQRPVLAGVSVFYPAPGSADYRWCQQKGLLPGQLSLMRATALPLVDTTDRVQAVTLLRLGRMLNFIKLLIDQGHSLPWPEAAPKIISESVDRMAVGQLLTAAFLKDGTIWGVDDQGRLYPHQIDAALARTFLQGLDGSIRLCGTRVQSGAADGLVSGPSNQWSDK